MQKKRRILILYTGGTFGMVPSKPHTGYEVPWLDSTILRDRVFRYVPELHEIAECDVRVIMNKDSAQVGPREWLELANHIRREHRWFDGFVILHGTDTMAYTASALSLLLADLKRPVVLTGAQRPLAEVRTDARRNLISAVEIAATGPRPLVNQVMIFFDQLLLRGETARKRSASDFNGFEGPKVAPLAIVGSTIRYAARVRPAKSKKFKTWAFSGHVCTLHVAPGFSAANFGDDLFTGLDALVLRVFPSGTAPTANPEFIKFLERARKRDVPVIAV